tara:strand:- start:5 stop:1306 length:1302 start_codon:yes stop_codon:yes gene_type:complete
MSRTPSSTGNRKTFTSSCWVKLGDLTNCALPMPTVAQTASYGMYLASGIIQVFIYYTGSAWQGQLYTNRVFRDPSAWFHLVTVVDTTQAISSERVRFYVNGQRETSFSTENYPNQNQDTDWNNSGEAMGIGVNANGFSGSFGEYYAAEMHYLDGLAYGPEFFGETNDNGIWVPKEYTGSYGTNGFYIKGADASALGTDSSGNGNNFTTSGLATHDQVLDSPTNSFAVMNPLGTGNGSTISQATFSNGNLEVSRDSVTIADPQATIVIPANFKCYFEVYNKDGGGSGDDGNRFSLLDENFLQSGTVTYFVNYYVSGKTKSTEQTESSPVTVVADGNIVSYAVDIAGGEVKVFIQGSLVKTFTIGSAYRSLNFFPASRLITLDSGFGNHIWNFGQEGTFAGNITAGGNSDSKGVGNFKYSVPSGFNALCTKNLGS